MKSIKKLLFFVECLWAEWQFARNYPDCPGYFKDKNGKKCGIFESAIARFHYCWFD